MTTSPRIALLVAATAATLATNYAGAQQQQPAPIRVAASSFASVEVHVNQRPIGRQWYEEDASLSGPARIAITDGQPHARGRKIVGGLIPNDTVWRFGANMATTLHTDLDKTRDIGRVTLSAKNLMDNEETLTLYLVPDSPQPRSGYAALAGVAGQAMISPAHGG